MERPDALARRSRDQPSCRRTSAHWAGVGETTWRKRPAVGGRGEFRPDMRQRRPNDWEGAYKKLRSALSWAFPAQGQS